MKTFSINYIKSYLPIIVVIIGILVYNYSTSIAGKQIEGLDNELSTDMFVSFCNKFEGKSSELETACNGLITNNCKNSNCCVWVNGNKCSAGGLTGPTFKSDKDGNKISIDNFYYMNKCYGKSCSK